MAPFLCIDWGSTQLSPKMRGNPSSPPPTTTILVLLLFAISLVASMPFHLRSLSLNPFEMISSKSRMPAASIEGGRLLLGFLEAKLVF